MVPDDGRDSLGQFPGDDDETLAGAAAGGDADAFARLLERHYDRIHRLAWRWCGSRPEAEDVTQEVCVKLATAIASFRGEASFATWLYRIAFTTATDQLRRRQRICLVEPSEMIGLIDSGAAGTDALPDAEAHVLNGELWAEVRALAPRQRDAVLLVYGEDLSHAEAAGILGCSEKTLSWHLHEARRRLKSKLEAVG